MFRDASRGSLKGLSENELAATRVMVEILMSSAANIIPNSILRVLFFLSLSSIFQCVKLLMKKDIYKSFGS